MMETVYKQEQPTRAEIDSLTGPAVLEFGTNWCGYCRGAQPAIAEAYRDFFFHYDDTPLLVVNCSEIDFVDHSEEMTDLVREIRSMGRI